VVWCIDIFALKSVIRVMFMITLSPDNLTRLEVIDENGSAFTRWNCKIKFSLQDGERTLKIFVEGRPLVAADVTDFVDPVYVANEDVTAQRGRGHWFR
jgi:hypothetical protein